MTLGYWVIGHIRMPLKYRADGAGVDGTQMAHRTDWPFLVEHGGDSSL